METIIVEIGKFINTYIVWIIIFIFIMFIISLVCFANYDDDTSIMKLIIVKYISLYGLLYY